jgi:hypothetical protein
MLMIGAKLNTYPPSTEPIRRAVTDRAEDDFDVLADGAVVGRIFKANAAPGASYKNPLRKTSHDIGHMSDQTTALP